MALDDKTLEILGNELEKNTEILESVVSKFNIQILNIAYETSFSNGEIEAFIEFTSLDGSSKIKNAGDCGQEIDFKINFYNGTKLIYSEEESYDTTRFSGYDTIKIFASGSQLIEKVTSARIFIVKGF